MCRNYVEISFSLKAGYVIWFNKKKKKIMPVESLFTSQ